MKFNSMLAPIQIGHLTVRNRFVVPPMGNNFANTDGTMSDRSLAYYRERAKGGFGLITIEASLVDEKSKDGTRKPYLFRDKTVKSLKNVVDVCHDEGARISIQLHHAGFNHSLTASGKIRKKASTIKGSTVKSMPYYMEVDEIYEIIELFGDAAARAKKAGADAVEINCAHGCLIDLFLSPFTNRRIDEFGGNFENRMRILEYIIKNIRMKAGFDIAVICCINGLDNIAEGMDFHDIETIAACLQDLGVDAIRISRCDFSAKKCIYNKEAMHIDYKEEILSELKSVLNIPIITGGYFTEPHYAELLIRQEFCDLVAFGRQSLADPFLPYKTAAGNLKILVSCINCQQGCASNYKEGNPISCTVNPLLGHESEFTMADKSKKVMVIGGGLGGMLAAWVSAYRGHEVTLYEQNDTLGGHMRISASIPGRGNVTNLIQSYLAKLYEYKVNIQLNTEVSAKLVKKEKPDVVIIATGSRQSVLLVPGIVSSGAVDAEDVIDGKLKCGHNVLVISGGIVGCETAMFLAENGHDVTVLGICDREDVFKYEIENIMDKFGDRSIGVVNNVKVTEIMKGGATYICPDGKMNCIDGFDTVVLAPGLERYNPISDDIKKIVSRTYVIGDAINPRRAIDVTTEAFRAAMSI